MENLFIVCKLSQVDKPEYWDSLNDLTKEELRQIVQQNGFSVSILENAFGFNHADARILISWISQSYN